MLIAAFTPALPRGDELASDIDGPDDWRRAEPTLCIGWRQSCAASTVFYHPRGGSYIAAAEDPAQSHTQWTGGIRLG